MTKEETLCTNCIHRHVCKYKQDYLEVTKAVLEATVNKNMESKPVYTATCTAGKLSKTV